MASNRDWLMMGLLHCGEYDLSLLDNVGYDWCDIIETDSTFPFNLNGVMRQVFDYGLNQIEDELENRIDYLRDTQKIYGISDEQEKELEELEKLDVWEDFETFHNYIDTHVWCKEHGNIYRAYLSAALDGFAEGTGFEITMN